MAENSVPSSGIPDEILHGTRKDIERLSAPAVAVPQQVPVPVLPPKSMSAIEDLLMFGSLKYETTIKGMRFAVKTLKISEKEDAYGAVSHLPSSSFVHFTSLRDELLARALEYVNGLPLASYHRPGAGEDVETGDMLKRVHVIRKMYSPIVDKLYELYNILEEKSSKSLSDVSFDDLKNS